MKLVINKKGFTLMELLVVIMIIGLITTFAIVSIVSITDKAKKDAYNNSIIGIKDSAYLYVNEMEDVNWYVKSDTENKKFTCVSIETLKDMGYLKKNSIDFEIDKTYSYSSLIEIEKDMTNSVISKEVVLNSGECATYDKVDPVVEIINKNDITFDIYDGSWVNHNVYLTVNAEDNNGLQSLKISFDGGFTWNDFNKDNVYEFSENMDKKVIVRATDNFYNVTEKEFNIRIDKNKPNCNIILDGTIGNDDWYTSDSVNLTLEYEDELSKIKDWDLTTSINPTYNMTDDSIDYNSNTTGISYYGYVRDKAGNVNDCSISFKKDSATPSSLSLGSVPSSFTVGSSYEVPTTSAVFGVSGGSTECSYNTNVITNTSGISSTGTYTIECVATSNSGKTYGVSKSVTVSSAYSGPGIPGIVCCSTDSYGNRVGYCC